MVVEKGKGMSKRIVVGNGDRMSERRMFLSIVWLGGV